MYKPNKNHLNDVSIIIVNYNSSSYTHACVSSIIDKTEPGLVYNIVVIDNCSAEDDYRNLESLNGIENVYVYRSKINLGFAGGNMLGIQMTNARYYLFLNNDCLFLSNCLQILYNFCESNPRVALCSPQMYSESGERIPSFDYFPVISSKIFGIGVNRLFKGKEFRERKGKYNEPVKVDVVSGSQMFVRADVFNKIGGLDTNFFLYCEEEDLALRINRQGYDTFLVPDARNIHIGGASTNRNMDIRKEFYISFIYFYTKHYGHIRTWVLKLILFLRLIRKIFKDRACLRLAFFILSGANLANSMKHKQQIRELMRDKEQS